MRSTRSLTTIDVSKSLDFRSRSSGKSRSFDHARVHSTFCSRGRGRSRINSFLIYQSAQVGREKIPVVVVAGRPSIAASVSN